jgi:hypothetical protein
MKQITVRDGKGAKDRFTVMAENVVAPCQEHLERVRLTHQQDLRTGGGSVFLSAIMIASCLLSGCATHSKPEATHERGWIGGRYKCAKARPTAANWISGGKHIIYCFPKELEQSQKSGVLAVEMGTNTPAYRAGLRAGDLILQLSHESVTSLPDFLSTISAARPGATLPVKAYRSGQTIECDITVGREKYQHYGTVMVGLPLFLEPPHLIPTREKPTLSLVAVGWEGSDSSPVEFDTVEQRYRHVCSPKTEQRGSDQDWRFWLAIFQVVKGKTILTQESVEASNAIPSR